MTKISHVKDTLANGVINFTFNTEWYGAKIYHADRIDISIGASRPLCMLKQRNNSLARFHLDNGNEYFNKW
jgi:hypothetical protein